MEVPLLRIHSVTLPPDEPESVLIRRAALKAGLREEDILGLTVVKKSVDAREKPRVVWSYTVDVTVRDEKAALKKARKAFCAPAPRKDPAPARRPMAFPQRPRTAVVGLGPAGLFAALALSQWGLEPLVLERGQSVEDRLKAVEHLRGEGILDEESNYQYGEGGAGAFSDGKLATGTKDPRQQEVLDTFVRFGAPEDILVLGRPHIGTDRLPKVVRGIREEIIRLGGRVRFGARLSGIVTRHGALTAIRWQEGERTFEEPVDALITAIGHSAEDTQKMLFDAGVDMRQKPFSAGFRIEHPQEMIDLAQYGAPRGKLPPAEYRLAVRCSDGRGVYTFCMCPGGQVVPAASKAGGVCVNGMSPYLRDGENANSAVLVDVRPEDFPDTHPLSGFLLQRVLEKRAFQMGGGGFIAPAQRAEDFLQKRPSRSLGSLVVPTYRPGVVPADLNALFPPDIAADLRLGLRLLDGRLKGFAHPDAVLTGVETRSSCPVRYERDSLGESNIQGLFPAGEGAGLAGGIMSAAVDGLRQAENVLRALKTICGMTD